MVHFLALAHLAFCLVDGDEIEAALMAHPDKGGTDELFQMVNEAYKILGDPALRAEYDRDLKKFNLKDG